MNLEPVALFRTDSDHVELDKVPNHGKHPMNVVYLNVLDIPYMTVQYVHTLTRVSIVLDERHLAAVEEVV